MRKSQDLVYEETMWETQVSICQPGDMHTLRLALCTESKLCD